MIGKHSGAVTLTASVTLLENLGSELVGYLDVSGTQIVTVVSHQDAGALNMLDAKSDTTVTI